MQIRSLNAFRSSNALLLTVVCAAVFTDIFLYGLLVPVLPFALTQRAGVPPPDVARWNGILLALYNLGLCVGSPLAGFYADHSSSRKLPYLLGLVALAGSTLLLCLGRTVALLAVGRVLQGASAAICWAVGLALVADAMASRMGWASGWVNGAMTVGFLLSPIVGGIAYARAGYYAVYYMAFGLIAVDIALRLLLKSREAPREAAPPPDSHPYLSLIKSRRLLMSLTGCAMQSASKFAIFAVVPSFVEATFAWDSLATGLIFLCVCLPGLLSPAVGILCDRYGSKWLSCAGFAVSVPLFVCLRFVTHDSTSQKVLFGALLTLLGVALTLSSTPLMADITYIIEDKEKRMPGIWGPRGVSGVGYALFATSFALGGVLGSFVAGYLYAASWGTFGWSVGIWCAGGAALCACMGNSRSKSVAN